LATFVRAYSEISGNIAYASSVNGYVDTLGSTINALNSANLITSGVDNININNGAVDADKLDGEIVFFNAVFSF